MPTGYTADLYEGKPQTFQEFALACSRAMGAAIMQRDSDASERIEFREVDDYYRERVQEARAALDEAIGRSSDEWVERERVEREKANDAMREALLHKAERRHRYESMLAEALSWEPPTDEHRGLRDFMVEQLESSIKFDCGWHGATAIEQRSAEEFATEEIEHRRKALAWAEKSLAEEEERAASQRTWVEALFASLGVER